MPAPVNLGKVCVIVDGGGFRAAYSVGFLEAIYSHGIVPAYLRGVSGGALNVSKVAETNSMEGVIRLKKIWDKVEAAGPSYVFSDQINPLLHPIDFLTSAHRCSDAGLKRIVSTLDLKRVLDGDVKVEIIVYDRSELGITSVTNRDPQFKEHPERFAKYILASASVPGIFPFVEIDGHLYCDGFIYEKDLGMLQRENDFDTFIILLNYHGILPMPDITGAWWKQAIMIPRYAIAHEVNEAGYQRFLRRNGEFKLYPESTGEEVGWLRRVRTFARTVVSELKNPVAKRMIIMTPPYNLPKLMLDKFRPGDITRAMQIGLAEGNRILNNLVE